MTSTDQHKDDQHFVSFYDFDSDVLGDVKLPSNIEIHDVTLRDGEQQAGITFRRDDKIKIATLLSESGVDRIEAGMPSVSAEDAKVVKEISHLGLGSKIYAFARCMKQDVDNAIAADVDGIVMEIPSSDHLIKHAYGWDVEKAVKLSVEATSYAHEHGLRVTFFTIDATRAPFDTFWKIAGQVIKDGHMDSFALADTFGVLNPQATTFFIKKIKSKTDKPVEIHAHNDFGLAVANTISAVLGGASTIHVSLTGIGERSGNASLEESVMALKYLYGINTKINTRMLRSLAVLARERSGVKFPPQKPIVGDGIFSVESGILTSWWRRLEKSNMPLEMFPFLPEVVGHTNVEIINGKKSGIDTIYYKADKFGIKLDESEALTVLRKLKSISLARKGPISDEELKALMDKNL
jgi:isopropylmalate/homocitrate/citramalate synthase